MFSGAVRLILYDGCAPCVGASSGAHFQDRKYLRFDNEAPSVSHGYEIEIEIEIEIVYNMYRMRRFTSNTVCAGCYLWALPTMPYRKLTSQG
jgi:hypothetical protein